MPQKPSPEALVADWVIRRLPRLKPIQEADLWKQVNWSNPHDKQLFNEHRDAALILLSEEGYIHLQPGVGAQARYGSSITLTVKGLRIKDQGGYITAEEAKAIKEAVLEDVSWHESKKKKWDNRSKYIYFSFGLLSAILTTITLWEKCAPHKKATDATAQHAAAPDSAVTNTNGGSSTKALVTPSTKDLAANNTKKHHPHPPTSNPSGSNTANARPANARPAGANPVGPNPTGSHQPTQSTLDRKEDSPGTSSASPLVTNYPLRIAHADDIEFKLMKVTGSKAAQTITITMRLTTSGANSEIYHRVHSIFDTDGNEYLLKSFQNGAQSALSNIPLTTGVPIKCTYTFGGILPSTRTVKLFTFTYLLHSGHTNSVEFRDIFVEWN